MNPGPHGPEPCALPNCASPRLGCDSIGALPQTPIEQTCQTARPTSLILEGRAHQAGKVEARWWPDLRRGGKFLATWRRRRALRP